MFHSSQFTMFRTGRLLIFPLIFTTFATGKPANLAQRLTHLIFPGTNWCGIGNIAKNYNDLGTETAVDSCCREHDSCPEEIGAGMTNYGLHNNYFISRLHCKCDKQLYDCLKKSTSPIASLIGNIYFNVLHYPCFAGKCPENYTLWWGECSSNEISRENQWYDIERF